MEVDVPESTLDKIQSQFHTDQERKTAVLRVYSTDHPRPTWDHVSDVLYGMRGGEYHSVLDTLQSLFPTGEYLSHIGMYACMAHADLNASIGCEYSCL